MEVSSLIFLLSIIFGQLFIESWLYAVEARLGGGINPNRMGFFVLYFIFQIHINSLIQGSWTMLRKFVWLLAVIVLLWTFSRTAILTFLTAYFIYLSYLAIIKFKASLTKGFNIASITSFFNKTFFFSLLVIITIYFGQKTNLSLYIVERFSNVENFTERSKAWEIILQKFIEAPLVGGYGWWGSEAELVSLEGVAKSAHNFFIRLLSEIGIFGLITIIALPTFVILLLLINNKKVRNVFDNYISIYVASALFSLFFVAQFFEDRYLSAIFTTTTDVIIWFISFGLIIYHTGMGKIDIKKH